MELINNPKSFEVNLPSIANRPYFQRVKILAINLMQAADLAGLKPETIYELNPVLTSGLQIQVPTLFTITYRVSDRFDTADLSMKMI